MKISLSAAASLAAALSLAGCAQAQNSQKSDPAFGEKVRAYLLEHPEVLREAMTKLAENERLEAAQASTKIIQDNRAAIERDARDLVINPNGAITITEFFDYRCGYCKMVAPEVAKLVQDNPDIRFVMKELPILSEISVTAAKAALTPQGKAKGLELYTRLMNEKALTDATLDKHLRDLGLDPAVVRQASATPEIAKQIADVRALAHTLQIEGTPAFIVGDRMVPGADMNALRAALVQARAENIRPAAK